MQEKSIGMGNSSEVELDASQQETLNQVLGSNKNPTACTWMWEAAPFKAWQELSRIAYYKADYIFNTYKKDFHRILAAKRILLRFTKQYSLVTGDDSNGKYVMSELSNAVSYFCAIYNERLFLKEDFTQWPNMQFLLGLARQSELLGGPESDVLDNLQKYDRFKLSMDVDVKIGKDGGYEMAHLQGDNYVALVPIRTRFIASAWYW